MLLAAVAVLLTSGGMPEVWRNYDEVFDLAEVNGNVVAATNGGLIERYGIVWMPLASPAGLRSIEQTEPLVVGESNGHQRRLSGRSWAPCSSAERSRTLETGMAVVPGAPWSKTTEFPIPPPSHVYALIQMGSTILAGTSSGVFRSESGVWIQEAVPSKFPISRPNGIAKVGSNYVIGGLGGLYVGRPGDWKMVCTDAIRELFAKGPDVWVVHGSGALDKLDLAADQLFPDVLYGASKRPFSSCVGWNGNRLVSGGIGGWSERGDTLVEHFPSEIADDVVTAITGRDQITWVGTEKSGLFRFGPDGFRRWNPGNGLTDTWVTSLCRTNDGLIVGTLHAGLFLVSGDRITKVLSPTQRVTQVREIAHALVVGGMDGAWIKEGSAWKELPTNGEETTSITELRRKLTIATASGVYIWSSWG